MLKKLSIIIILLISSFTISKSVSCYTNCDGEYTSYAWINCNQGKLLRDYNKTELNDYIKKFKRRFSGWTIKILNRNARVDFISELVYSFYNEGDTPIKYNINISEQTTNENQFTLKGSLKFELSGDIKKIKSGLDTSVQVESSHKEIVVTKAQESISLEVDPKTVCVVYISGSGLLTNGVACRYFIYTIAEKGYFEFFNITNINLRIEKVKI